jgi:UDP:flavonoid glycosyltransferase YjiC (YdhE family)
MHYLLTPVGSAGDVHPYLGIGRELRRRGHEATLLASEPFQAAAERAGIGFVGIGSREQFDLITRHPDLWHPQRGMRLVLRTIAETLRPIHEALDSLYEPGRAFLVGHPLALATRTFEDVTGAPAATVHIAPGIFRSEYVPPVMIPGRELTHAPRWLKRGLWWLTDRAFLDRWITPDLNAWRRELGLPPVRRVFQDWIHSPKGAIGIFPDWFAPPQPDWPPQVRLTGFLLFDDPDEGPIDPQLEAFLDAGDPPIVFTPGSANRQAPRFFKAGVGAARSLGRRALLLTAYPEQLPGDLPETVMHVSYAPFSQVLPRCAAIAHHGGIGTCAQGLAAGIPQLTMPMGFDQPDNAARLQRLGVGRWLTPPRFTSQRVAATLGELLESTEVTEACRDYRSAIEASDAIADTCRILEDLARGEHS